MSYQLHKATGRDQAAPDGAIARSVRGPGTPVCTPQHIEGALRGAFGVDTPLVGYGRNFVVDMRWLAALVLLTAGCSGIPQPRVDPPPVASAALPTPTDADADAAIDAGRGEFAIAASMLDTWNAAGQILVRLDGVTYEGRAQMLGIYVVRYRGERFLILTRALVMRSQAQGMLTKVGAVLMDGKPNDSDAAVELLGLLQARLPAELARIKAGGR